MADDTGAVASATGAAGSSPAPNTTSSASRASDQPASATETPSPQTGSVATSSDGSVGEPPKERWSDILANTRTKTRAEVEKEYRQKYGWAEQFQQDPYAFVERWVDQLAEHPQYQTQMLAKAARLLNSRRGAQAPDDLKADVPIVDANGNVTGYTYRAEVLDQLLERRLGERLQPLEHMREAITQQAQLAQIAQQSDERARSTLAELRQNPYFKEHEAKVRAALEAHEEWGDNVHAAFNHVLITDILPGLSQHEQRQVVESLQQKASASTVSPSGTQGHATPKFKTHREALEWYSKHPQEAEAMANR